MKNHTVAVILATYNGERYLQKFLDSLENQTHIPDELIVGDDCSTDSTLAILANFKEQSKIRVAIHQNPLTLGYGENFLSTAARAESELIAFADQDDIWFPEKLAKCLSLFDDPEVVMCAHTATLIDGNDNTIGHFSQGITAETMYPAGSLEPWGVFFGFSVIIRKSVLQAIPLNLRGPDCNDPTISAAHDRWAYFLADVFGKTATISEPLVYYRQHESNLFGNKDKMLSPLSQPLAHIIRRSNSYIAIAEHRSSILQHMALESSLLNSQTILNSAAQRWTTVASSERQRLRIYTEKSRIKRLLRLIMTILSGAYQTRKTTAKKRKAILKDIVCLIK